MESIKNSIFNYLDYRSFLNDYVKVAPRGIQTKLAASMKCQGTYLIRVLKGQAQLTEEQAYRGGIFIKLSASELEFFLDLVRFDKAGDPALKKHFEKLLKSKITSHKQVQNRVNGSTLKNSLLAQVEYFSDWKPSVLHLATNCSHLQTERELAERFSLNIDQVKNILQFLQENGLVKYENEKYSYTGDSIHLSKDSPLHKPFQRLRREMVLRSLDKPAPENLHFSSAFATSKKHIKVIRENFLKMIEMSHQELESTDSEEVMMLVVDFFRVV